MNGVRRQTLRSPAEIRGRGLFSGAPARAVITPAPAGHGVGFEARGVTFPALVTHVPPCDPNSRGRARWTTLSGGGASVMTVEHLLSALRGLGVTDALVSVEGPEVPILDGSAEVFVDAVAAGGGLEPLAGEAQAIIVREPIEARDDTGAWIRADPLRGPHMEYRYTLDYGPGAAIAPATAVWDGGAATYQVEVAPARTYCLASEAAALRAAGLFADLSPRDFLVLDDATGRPIENTLRFPDEPARHKLLDLIGDLSLIGRPILARVTAYKSGHALAHAFARRVLELY
ncbi:MAG: UDP-3-O-acyl-N-acetylglucosamine deacetylase [Phycisphaeraceae bacterium]|nr:MAG: UDP-3-O-acyl-N-acetylglucosamine deacetylase [Phycisphaeraceae bacterium]